MTPEDLKSWRKAMNISQVKAAEALGVYRRTIENYERGRRIEDGRTVEIPKVVALACAALFHRLEPWQP